MKPNPAQKMMKIRRKKQSRQDLFEFVPLTMTYSFLEFDGFTLAMIKTICLFVYFNVVKPLPG
jgi:hypothetical protein